MPTLRNIRETCNNFNLPAFSADMHALEHCGWQMSDPEGCAAMLDAFVRR